MKWRLIAVVMVLMCGLILSSCECDNTEDQKAARVISGPYLGFEPPGETPVLFAPGVVADEFAHEHGSTIFTPDGNDVFWTHIVNSDRSMRLCVVLHMKQENGVWTEPELATFNSWFFNFSASISPDGNRLYLHATRYLNEGDEEHYKGAWVVHRTADGWRDPEPVPLFTNWDKPVAKLYETKSGNMYFTSNFDAGRNAINCYRSDRVDGECQEPVALDETINKPESMEYAFFVDPDERYIVFASDREGGYTGVELYISYHMPDGSWSEAINLGSEINAMGPEGSGKDWPYMSPDGKYLFFTATIIPPYQEYIERGCTYEDLKKLSRSQNNGFTKIYWVRADFIEKLKPEGWEGIPNK